jgi:CBS domain containing-hemolysin-like protein
MTVLTLLLGLVVVLMITVATGYFVAQEFAYMAVDRSRLKARAEAGDPDAARALAVTRRTSFMLSGAQLGITVTGLLVGYVAEPLIGQSLGSLLGGVGIPVGVSIGLGAVVALLVSTLVQMLFGELFPKNLAIARPEPTSLALARSTTLYLALFGWLIWFFDQSSNMLLRLLRIEPVHDVEHSASARDLEHIVADFPTQDVEHAMIPRTRVATVHDSDTLRDVRALMEQGHSRYPVLSQADGDVVGVVHLADLLTTTEPETAPVSRIQRSPLVLSHLMTLPAALQALNSTSNQMACVVDEHGGLVGVLTLEDLAEELVGEITDEHDLEVPDELPTHADGEWIMAGSVHVDEVERALSIELPEGDYETLAGLAIAHHGSLPDPGAVIEIALEGEAGDLLHDGTGRVPAVELTVLSVERHVPGLLRLVLQDPGHGEPGDEDAGGGDDGG